MTQSPPVDPRVLMATCVSCTALRRPGTRHQRLTHAPWRSWAIQQRHSDTVAQNHLNQRERQRWRRQAAAGEDGGESVDIDALAARLAAEAERLRQSGAYDLDPDQDGGPERPPPRREAQPDLSPFGYEVRRCRAWPPLLPWSSPPVQSYPYHMPLHEHAHPRSRCRPRRRRLRRWLRLATAASPRASSSCCRSWAPSTSSR